VAALAQMPGKRALQLERGMVGGNGDTHLSVTKCDGADSPPLSG
jgi:hypothetical protein